MQSHSNSIGIAKNLSWEVARGTPVSWGPKGRNSRLKADSGEEVLAKGQLEVWGSAVTSPCRVQGRAPTANAFQMH